jgi:hypothetical protein
VILESWKRFVAESNERRPKIYFHVTSQDNIESIQARGILGSKQAGDRDQAYSDEDSDEKRVYFFSTPESAYMASFSRPDSGIFGGAGEPPYAFVKVNLAKIKRLPEIYDDIDLSEFEAFYIVGDVPPHAILDIETEAEVTERLEYEEEDEQNLDVDGDMLYEDKEAVRVFEVELFLKIRAGVEATLTDIRSIEGVTIVSSAETRGSVGTGGYTTKAKIKFHPQKEAMTGQSYVKQILIPTINSRAIPNCIVQRFVPKSLRQI